MTSKLGEKGSDGESWDRYFLTDEQREKEESYFNSYEKILKDLYGQEEERKKLGFTDAFEFAVYETLLKQVGDGNLSKNITNKIFLCNLSYVTKI